MSVHFCSLGSGYSRFFSEHRYSDQGTPVSCERPDERRLPELADDGANAFSEPGLILAHTAVVAGFVISALGGSRTQIGGPTGAFVVIVAGIVVKFGLGGLALVGIMAGILLLIMGLTGLGTAVRYIPRPVTIGFTNGIALLIASTQIKDFLGLKTPTVPSESLPRIRMLVDYVAGIVHALTLLAILLVAAPLARFVPLATLAAVLFVVAYNMGEWREIGIILRLSKTDIAVWVFAPNSGAQRS